LTSDISAVGFSNVAFSSATDFSAGFYGSPPKIEVFYWPNYNRDFPPNKFD
jgi:hypothetical protein